MLIGLEDIEFCGGELITIGSRPAMGKTALALTIARYLSQIGKRVFYVSLAESKEMIVEKIISAEAQVETQKFRKKTTEEKIYDNSLTGAEYQQVIESKKLLEKQSFEIMDLKTWALDCFHWEGFYERLMKSKFDIDIIFIDYIQMINVDELLNNRHAELDRVLIGLKTIAAKFNIPVVILSQLGRKVEERQGHDPYLTDLKECGSIEDISDKIFMLKRMDYYDPCDKPGLAQLHLQKNRYGPNRRYNLAFRKEFCSFSNYTPIEFSL